MKTNNILLGSHIGMSSPDYFYGSVVDAINFGENTFMIYTGAPQNTVRVPIKDCKIAEGLELLKKSSIDSAKIIVHAPYIINIANTIDNEKFSFSIQTLENEIKRASCFGAKILVLHPGAAVGAKTIDALNKVVEGLDNIFSKDKTDIKIAIETMAGKGTEIGKTFDEIGYIIKNSKYPNRLGVCFDTCHVNDSGYNLDDIDYILTDFDKKIGLNFLLVIHLNDSKNIIGSHKDRHENIGFGTIGFDTLMKYVYDDRLLLIPKILETPYVNELPPYKKEIIMIKSKKFDPNLKTI